jgi:transcriptional regulator with PAS, ATPase and Fis domain
MHNINWHDDLNVAVTVSDNEGNILYMNNKSSKTFAKYGGESLIGKNLRDCHKPESWKKIAGMIENGETNAYTIEKEGVKKLIYQTPWFTDGKISGMVELSLEIPFEMAHFIRK